MNRTLLALALLVSPLCPSLAGDAVRKGHEMDSIELSATFPGMTMVGNYGNGVKFSETYNADGSLIYFDDEGADKGRWFTRGNLFCTFYDTYNGACYAVRQSGPNCYEYYTEEEEDGSTHAYEGAWNSVGWDVSKETTCDLTDKTS